MPDSLQRSLVLHHRGGGVRAAQGKLLGGPTTTDSIPTYYLCHAW
jgi:hypothetical protein